MRVVSLLVTGFLVLLAGCAGSTDVPEDRSSVYTFGGELEKRKGEVIGTSLHTFDVPIGATAVQATLTWEGSARLQVTLRPPEGAPLPGSSEKAGRVSLVTSARPVPGVWEARVSAGDEGRIPFTLTVVVDDKPPKDVEIDATVQLARGRLAEANVVLEAGARVTWSFEAARSVKWDVHTHDPETGAVSTPAEGRDASRSEAFTAPASGLYSFALTADEGDTPLTYRLKGVMRVHSYAQG